jgi:lipid-binding SYLF domain-containing protein
LALATSALAVDKIKLDYRVRSLTAKFEAMQQKPDRRVPADVLARAQGIILLDRTKAGVVFAFQGGSGVAMVKDPKTKKWGPAAFVQANEASLGFQIGGEQNFVVFLLLNTNATQLLVNSNFEFGGEARGTAGNETAGEEGKIGIPELPVVVYADRKGLYGGAAIKGGAISPDAQANRVYYEQYLTMKEILFDQKVKSTEPVSDLARKLADYSKTPEVSKN